MISIHFKNGFIYKIENSWFMILMDHSKTYWTPYPVKFSEEKLPDKNTETLNILSEYPYNLKTSNYEGITVGPEFGDYNLGEGYKITAALNIISDYIKNPTIAFLKLQYPIEEDENSQSSNIIKNDNEE